MTNLGGRRSRRPWITAALIPPSLWAVYSYFSRGPDVIELTAGAIVLRYRGGAAVSVARDLPSLKTGSNGPGQSETVGLRGPWHKYTRIDPDVSRAIIDYAEARGLLVERSSSKASDGTWNRVLITPSTQS